MNHSTKDEQGRDRNLIWFLLQQHSVEKMTQIRVQK